MKTADLKHNMTVTTKNIVSGGAEKDNFYDKLHPVVAEIPTSEILIL